LLSAGMALGKVVPLGKTAAINLQGSMSWL